MNTQKSDQNQDVFGEVIYTYTRKQAIEDGCQVLLENNQADLAKEAGLKVPVYLTSGVHDLIKLAVSNEKHCNDFAGVLWDILYMGVHGTGTMLNESLKQFQVIITSGRKKYHTLFIEIGPMDFDNPAPVATIMLPSER